MILDDLGGENSPIYRELEISNLTRQYHFLRSIVDIALKAERLFLSQTIIKAINYHAIVCLHVNAGEYRPCKVTVGNHTPPDYFRVSALMDDFVNMVNRYWLEMDAIQLSAYVLWRLNWIHPFINGNGRTARAACHFVLCVRANGWIGRRVILPELLRQNREQYVASLRQADTLAGKGKDIATVVTPVSAVITSLLNKDAQD